MTLQAGLYAGNVVQRLDDRVDGHYDPDGDERYAGDTPGQTMGSCPLRNSHCWTTIRYAGPRSRAFLGHGGPTSGVTPSVHVPTFQPDHSMGLLTLRPQLLAQREQAFPGLKRKYDRVSTTAREGDPIPGKLSREMLQAVLCLW